MCPLKNGSDGRISEEELIQAELKLGDMVDTNMLFDAVDCFAFGDAFGLKFQGARLGLPHGNIAGYFSDGQQTNWALNSAFAKLSVSKEKPLLFAKRQRSPSYFAVRRASSLRLSWHTKQTHRVDLPGNNMGFRLSGHAGAAYDLKRSGPKGQSKVDLSPVELVQGEVSLGTTKSFGRMLPMASHFRTRKSRLSNWIHASAEADGNPTAAEPTRRLQLRFETRSHTVDQGRARRPVGQIQAREPEKSVRETLKPSGKSIQLSSD